MTTIAATFRRSLDGFHAIETISSLVSRIALASEIRSERRALARLDAETLADVGISASAARAEALRGFADIPPSRL